MPGSRGGDRQSLVEQAALIVIVIPPSQVEFLQGGERRELGYRHWPFKLVHLQPKLLGG